MIKDMDPWIHGSAAGAAARAAAGAAGGAAASATLCTYYVIIGGPLRGPPYLHDKVHTLAAEASAQEAAPAAVPWIHGSIFVIMKHIFGNEMKNTFGILQ